MKKLSKCMLIACLSFFVLFITVGYATTTSSLNIVGVADSTPPEKLYVTTTQLPGTSSGGEVDNLYHVMATNVNSTVILPSERATFASAVPTSTLLKP